MSTTQELKLVIEAQNRANAALGAVKRQVEQIGEAAQRSTETMKGLAAAFGIATGIGAIAGIAKGIVGATVAMEGYNARLMTVLGTQKAVNQTLAFLSDFAKRTPFELNEVVDAYTRLVAYGLQPTAKNFQTIGDFAASAHRTFTDTVEAIADATHGEFERLREFGLTKEMIQGMDKKLINAKGQITDYAKFQVAIFQAMADRSAGAMERLQNTIEGKWSNLKDALFRASASIGDAIKVPIGNAIEAVTRLIERLATPATAKKVGDAIARMFSLDHMKTFAKALIEIGFSLKDFFANTFGQGIALLKEMIALSQSAMSWAKGLARGGNATRAGRDMFGEAKGFLASSQIYRKEVESYNTPTYDAKGRAAASRFIDGIFAGLSDAAKPQKDGKPAKFSPLAANPAAATTGLDRITELILGGGALARLGVKASQLGAGLGGARNKPIIVDIRGSEKHLTLFVRAIVKDVVTGLVKDSYLAVPGGR